MLHPYPFKWRPARRFHGLLVMILANVRRASELDIMIARSASEIQRLKNELINLDRQDKKGKKDEKKVPKKTRAQKGVDRVKRGLEKEVVAFCSEIRRELSDFMRIEVDADTLDYRESEYMKNLARVLLQSKKMDAKAKEALIKGVKEEMESLGRKAEGLELRAKQLERGMLNTVALSQISPWGNRWIERNIRIKAIEIDALHKRLESDKGEGLFNDFEREIQDIYEIGSNIRILMKRLKTTFNSMRAGLRDVGIAAGELENTRRFFERSFKRIEIISKRLRIEMRDQAYGLRPDLRAA